MSTGNVICSICKCRVIQLHPGPDGWVHVDGNSVLCHGASAEYADPIDPLVLKGRRQAFEMIRTAFVTMRGEVHNKHEVITILNRIWPFIADSIVPEKK